MNADRLLKKKQRAKRDGNMQQLAETIKDLGDLYFENGQVEDALQEYLEQVKICKILDDKLNCAIAHRMIGEVYANLGDYKQALIYQNMHLEGAKEIQNLLEEQRAFATLGRTYFCLAESLSDKSGERDEALANAKKSYARSIHLCNELQNTDIKLQELITMRARLLLNLGLVLDVQKESLQAIDLIEKAAALCKQHNLQEDLHRTHLSLAAIYERQENYELSLKHLDTAADISNVSLKAEAHLAKAELLLRMGKWLDSRKLLVSLYVTNGLLQNTKSQVQKYLKIVVAICRAEDSLDVETDISVKQKLYETLGDAAVAVHCFEKAIEYYQEMLRCAEECKSDQIGAALISLAQTLKDAGKYKEAINYARREFELCIDSPEICRSAIFLADLLMITKSDDTEIEQLYNLALSNAKESENLALEASVMKEFLFYLENSAKIEKAKAIKEKLDVIMISVTDTSDSEDSEILNIGADICLEDLSDLENESRIKNNISTRKRTKRGLVVKRNEKGETQLHVACINGSIDTVERLLENGHPTNVRDHCGWTPLHEAANHDYTEIAEMLLKHGADVNDPGGSLCGGVTPLHDAASCGNISMIHVLMQHGANITLRTKEGDTVLDCLEAWKDRAGSLSFEEQQKFDEICKKLSAVISRNPRKHKKQSEPSKNHWNSLIDDDKEEKREENRERISAGEDYKRTIASLKRRESIVRPITNQNDAFKAITPLIDNEEELMDDWLEDDIGINVKKKAFSDSIPTTSKRKSHDINNTVCENDLKRPKIDSVIEDINSVTLINEDSSDSNVSDITSVVDRLHTVKRKRQTSLLSIGFTRDSVSRTPSPVPSFTSTKQSVEKETVNLGISIKNKLFNFETVLFPEGKDIIENIINSVVNQFHSETGCKPKINLETVDGNSVSPENICNIMKQGEGTKHFKCKVIEMEVPSIVERYKIICQTYNIAVRESTIKSLKSCENTCTFRLKQYEYDDKELSPLLKSLEYQKNIRVLQLSGGACRDLGKTLNQCIGGLSDLQELYMQNCDIDFNCLNMIINLPLQLRVLDLSYNPLQLESKVILQKLLAPLKYLQTLNLCYCQLDGFHLTLKNNTLVNLDVSWNVLSESDICHFLPQQLLNLNLSNTVSLHDSFSITNVINNCKFNFLTLESLELAFCNISDTDIENILTHVPNLSKIVLGGNERVSMVSINKLLSHTPTLMHIDVSGCQTINEPPAPDVSIKNPEVCTFIATMVFTVCELWFYLWQGKGTMNNLPHNLIVFKPM